MDVEKAMSTIGNTPLKAAANLPVIRTMCDGVAFYGVGCDRIGASAGAHLLKEEREKL